MRASTLRAVVVTLAAGITTIGLGIPVSAGPAPHAAAAITSPITVTMPAASNATISQAQYSSQDVWAGVLSGVATPPSGISPLQRLANLNPPNFRIHAGTDGGAPAVDLPFNAAYTSQDGIHVNAWDFNHLNSLIGNTVGRTSGSMMLNIRYAPDNMFGGSGPLGGNGNAPGALLDQTYGAFATYMANLVKYYNTASPPSGATPARPASIGPIRYWEIWNEPDFSSENPRIPPSLAAPSGITLTGVNVSGGTLTAGSTYSYRLTALAATNQEGLPSAAVSITLPANTNAVHLSWNPSVNLGRVGAAYSIYGRTATVGQLVVVGKDNPAGLSWTDKGTIAKGGGVPVTDQTPGGPVFSPLEYKAMWDKVVPAMKAVDPTIKVVGPVTTNPISIASGSVDPTVVTSGPNDSSWLDNRDYVQVLMTSVNKPDVISYHGYGGYQGNVDTDSSLMSTVSQIAADVQSNILPYAGTTPIWHTEANVNAGDDSTNRPALAFGAAWEASLFAKLAPIGVSTIHEYSYTQSPTFGLITEPGSPVAGAVEGNPYLPYWVEYWIDHLIAPGAKILPVSNVPAGFDVLAVANPPDFTRVKMLVVNRQVPATTSSVPVQLTGASSTATRVRVIDSATNLVNGPTMTDAGASQSVNLQLNGYSVGLVEFDTGPALSLAAVLPALSNGAYGGYVTSAYVRNNDANAATVSLQYFDQGGNAVGSGDSVSLPGHATWTVRQDNGHSFAAGAAGSALVYTSSPSVSAFVNEAAPNNGDGSSYTGIAVPGGTGTTLYAPAIASSAYGGYTTGLGLLNLGSAATNITITYRDAGGSVTKTQTLSGIAAKAYVPVYSGNSGAATDARLASGFAGTATITSSGGQPLAAIVNEVGPGGQFSSYDTVPAGATRLNAPATMNGAYGGYHTGIGVQDVGGAGGAVTITYYDPSGAAVKTVGPLTLAANGYLPIYQGDATLGPPVSTTGYTAVLTSGSEAITAIVNEVAPPTAGSSLQQSTSYNSFTGSGQPSLTLPLVENAGSDGWSTGEGIMNSSGATETVTVTYFDAATGSSTGTTQTMSLAPNAYWGLYQPSGGLPAGSRASALISAGGGSVAAIVNESSATSLMSYDGQ